MVPTFHQALTERVQALSMEALVALVHDASVMLAEGYVINPARQETVGRPGDADYFRLDMPATLLVEHHREVVRGRKVIDEAGAADASGARKLGRREAWLALHHVPTGQTARLAADALTDRRTGAAAALAVSYLVHDVRTVALVGTGRVARQIALALEPHVVLRVTSRNEANRRAFEAALTGQRPGKLTTHTDLDATLVGADAVIAAVPSPEPLLTVERVAGLQAVVAVEGDPRTRLVAPELLARGPVVVDHLEQARQTGSFLAAQAEGVQPNLAQWQGRTATIGDVAAQRLPELMGQGAVAVLTGLAVHDVYPAATVWLNLPAV